MARAKLISMRVPEDDLEILKVAAMEERRSLTNYLITHGLEQARRTLAASATKPALSGVKKRKNRAVKGASDRPAAPDRMTDEGHRRERADE